MGLKPIAIELYLSLQRRPDRIIFIMYLKLINLQQI